MGNPFMVRKRTVGFKVESTPYTVESSLAASNYLRDAYNISYTPEIENAIRKYAAGDYSAFSSIIGKKKFTVSFSMDIKWSGGATTAPIWGDLLEACGFIETIGSSVDYETGSNGCSKPITIEVQERMCDTTSNGLILKGRGMCGNSPIVGANVGETVRFDFEFQGVLHSIEDRVQGSLITPSGADATEPDAMLAATITAYGTAQPINSVNINPNNIVEMYIDPSNNEGYRGAYIVDRDPPSISLDPYMDLLANDNMYSRWSAATTGAFSMTVGSNITISAPKMQVIDAYKSGERGGMSVNAIEGILTRDSGNDELKISNHS